MDNTNTTLTDVDLVLLEQTTIQMLVALESLNIVRIKTEQDYLFYVDIYATLLNCRDVFEYYYELTGLDKYKIRFDICRNKTIKLHTKVNHFTQTRFKHLRGLLYEE
jgi:hypothetical protein